MTPPGLSIFSKEALDKIVTETLPADAQPGEKILVAGVDRDGVKVAAVFKLKEHWELKAAFEHDWTGDDKLGAQVIGRWK